MLSTETYDEIVAVVTGMVVVGSIAHAAYRRGRRDEATLQATRLQQQAVSLMMLMVLHPIPEVEPVKEYQFVTKFGAPIRVGISRRVAFERYGITIDHSRTFQVHVHVGTRSAYVGTTIFRNKQAHLWGGANVREKQWATM